MGAPDRPDCDVIVIGAGISGLFAARTLERSGFKVLVLEASERLGGRMRTAQVGADHVDLGAHWIGPGQDRIASLARELKIATRPQPMAGRSVISVGGARRLYRGSVPRLAPSVMADVALGTTRLWWRYRGLTFDGGSWGQRQKSLDTINGAEIRDTAYRSSSGRALFDMTVALLTGAYPADLSALYMLTMFEAGGGLKRLSDFKGGAQQDIFIGGSQQICDRLADRLSRQVVLETPVRAIEQAEDSVTIRTAARAYTGRYCIIAFSPGRVLDLDFSPGLPHDRVEALRRTRLGGYSKVIAFYERPWWRNAGLNGIGLSADGPMQMVVDGLAESGRGMLVGFITGPHGTQFSSLDSAARRELALAEFTRILGPAPIEPVDYLDYSWTNHPWLRGGHMSTPEPGAMTALGGLPSAPVGRLHWASSELGRINHGYMDGAIESGQRAAEEIIARA
ncbi:MAG TPA: FAD-dependent oxidoreductase [Candidatus Binataceae bacterium]|nr:FAD-dependent oxidoreductase [Candidatus Binataceae bacterium]